jgi:hypothetical protein
LKATSPITPVTDRDNKQPAQLVFKHNSSRATASDQLLLDWSSGETTSFSERANCDTMSSTNIDTKGPDVGSLISLFSKSSSSAENDDAFQRTPEYFRQKSARQRQHSREGRLDARNRAREFRASFTTAFAIMKPHTIGKVTGDNWWRRRVPSLRSIGSFHSKSSSTSTSPFQKENCAPKVNPMFESDEFSQSSTVGDHNGSFDNSTDTGTFGSEEKEEEEEEEEEARDAGLPDESNKKEAERSTDHQLANAESTREESTNAKKREQSVDDHTAGMVDENDKVDCDEEDPLSYLAMHMYRVHVSEVLKFLNEVTEVAGMSNNTQIKETGSLKETEQDKAFTAQYIKELIARLFAETDEDDNSPISLKSAALIAAAHCGIISIVSALLGELRDSDEGVAEPQARFNKACSDAAQGGHLEVVRALLSDPRVYPSEDDDCGLGVACENGHLDIVKLLVTEGKVRLLFVCLFVFCVCFIAPVKTQQNHKLPPLIR